MRFNFSPQNLTPHEHRLQRFLEILPGFCSWVILIGLTALSIYRPIIAGVIIIAFDFYWILRLMYSTIFLTVSYGRLHLENKTDWMARVKGIDHLEDYLKTLSQKCLEAKFKERLSLNVHYQELKNLKNNSQPLPLSQNIFHLIIFPVAKEPLEVLEPAIQSLTHQDFPLKQLVVFIALEQRAPLATQQAVQSLHEKYQHHFYKMAVILHPGDIDGEAKVKGANATYAAKRAAQFFYEAGISFEHVTVSCFDADTVVSPHYFSCLTYYFLITPNRAQASFQPIPVYHNNIWEVPGIARVMETGSSFYQLIEATHPEKLVTFSSHSMSFKALTEVDYWPVDMISDDSAIFWKCFIHYDGQYTVIPMYITISMDVPGGDTIMKTIQTIYKQKRRWAWGVENLPIVGRAFLQAHAIAPLDRVKYFFKLFEGHVSWATWGFILTFIGWFPFLLGGHQFRETVVFYNIPQITVTIFNLASVSFFISLFLSMALLPKHKVKFRWLKKIIFAFEWLTLPFIMVLLSSLPALDAQTRLLFGRYMEFWVTDKSRKKK